MTATQTGQISPLVTNRKAGSTTTSPRQNLFMFFQIIKDTRLAGVKLDGEHNKTSANCNLHLFKPTKIKSTPPPYKILDEEYSV